MRPDRILLTVLTMALAVTAQVTSPSDIQAVDDRTETTADSRTGRRQKRRTTVAERLRRHELLFTSTSPGQRRLRQATLFTPPTNKKAQAPSTRRVEDPAPLAPSQMRLASTEFPVQVRGDVTPQRTVVFLVHGTYGATGRWFLEVPRHATFASELRRALRQSDMLVPFVWESSVSHKVRVKAARNLAADIRQKTRPTDRIVIVGHSHGGNVALQAVKGCGRTIDIVVCLSTPHMYLSVQGADGRLYNLPVYCPPETGTRIRNIVCITPDTDGIIALAGTTPGIDTNQALAATSSWRDVLGGINLTKDRTPLAELLLGTEGSAHQNVVVGTSLNATFLSPRGKARRPHNIMYASRVHDGQDAHSSAHSRRLGFLTGCLIRYGISASSHYLQSYTEGGPLRNQAGRFDLGEPVPLTPYLSAIDARRTKGEYTRVGWLLYNVSATAPQYSLPDDAVPDLYYDIARAPNGRSLFKSRTFWNQRTLQGSPRMFLPGTGQSSLFAVELWDANVFDSNSRLGPAATGVITVQRQSQGSSSVLRRDVHINTEQWSAKFSWFAVHH